MKECVSPTSLGGPEASNSHNMTPPKLGAVAVTGLKICLDAEVDSMLPS